MYVRPDLNLGESRYFRVSEGQFGLIMQLDADEELLPNYMPTMRRYVEKADVISVEETAFSD